MGPKKGNGSEQRNGSLPSKSAKGSDEITREVFGREAEGLGETLLLLSPT